MSMATYCLALLSWSVDPSAPSRDVAMTKTNAMVVCPVAWQEEMRRWIDYRESQGATITVETPGESAGDVKEKIKKTARDGDLAAILLVGDAQPQNRREAREPRERCVPTCFVSGKVNAALGESRDIASDAPYGDLDGDGAPDLAVGRWPVDSVDELRSMIDRTIALESDLDHGLWRRRVNVVAGVGDFGAVADTVLEQATRACLTGNIPAGYDVRMTYASRRSPYFPAPDKFRDASLERLNEGCLFWAYIGHGAEHSLDFVRWGQRHFPILRNTDCREIACRQGAPIAVFFCCYAGAYDHPTDCLVEQMLRREQGPVAAIAASRIAAPYSLALFGRSVTSQHFHGDAKTLGDAFMQAKRMMVKHRPKFTDADELPDSATPDERLEALIDSAAALLSPTGHDLATEQREHADLLNLFGDPLLRLRKAGAVETIVAEPKTVVGKPILVKIRSPIAGKATIELACRRGQQREKLAPPSDFAEFNAQYQAALDVVWRAEQREVSPDEIEIAMQPPPAVRGRHQIRVFVQGANDHALGAADVELVEP